MVWISVRGRVPVALTIAGSDSGGGAGIEADLKTFAALGVHGAVALTAVTAQSTVAVTGVQDVVPELVGRQIDAVAEDLGVDAAKTGMLHTSDIIRVVAERVRRYGFPLVVDPVMVAKSGARLLREEAIATLVEELIPLATVVTPNAMEAEVLSGVRVRGLEGQVEAARRIAELGPRAVVVKGGHLGGRLAVDVLYYEGETYRFEAPRLETKTTHGTGCSFSAAIAAGLAKGLGVVEAVRQAKELVTAAVKYGIRVGRGHGPVNPLALLYKESERYRTWREVLEAVRMIESSPETYRLVPEVGMNVAMAVPYADGPHDVVAVPGRIRRAGRRVVSACPPEFGGSDHLARYILTAMEYDCEVRAAVNIRLDERALALLEGMGLTVSFYDRREEPEEVKRVEGATIPWGVRAAVERAGRLPDVIYHTGDWGKEPMIVILGRSAKDLARLVVRLAERLAEGEGHEGG
ncbi:MAG: bifunctional hydroxymethylpyrimidine kinase/phosphomethylpyrimidine kinase [Thermoprotei archaeon]|nr:MAG: bifunctional hydroxymethylpyrimidine kinase/phosphomethylpyrimidine kinase [Thermoprotei archaeon]